MIYLLGGSGYVGQVYQQLLTRKNVPFCNLRRAELDYTQPAVLAAALKRDRPEFLINAAGYTGKPNVDACELHKAECLFGNAVLPGLVAQACAEAGVPWGHVSSGCIYSGARPDGKGFTEEDTPNFTFRTNHCSFYSGTKALGEEVLSGQPNIYVWRLRIPFDHIDSPRNYLTKLIRYQRLLEATNSISQLHEFVAATFACWEKRVTFGTYNVTNPGESDDPRSHRPDQAERRVHEGVRVLQRRRRVHACRRQDSALQLRDGLHQARLRRHHDERSPRCRCQDLKKWQKSA